MTMATVASQRARMNHSRLAEGSAHGTAGERPALRRKRPAIARRNRSIAPRWGTSREDDQRASGVCGHHDTSCELLHTPPLVPARRRQPPLADPPHRDRRRGAVGQPIHEQKSIISNLVIDSTNQIHLSVTTHTLPARPQAPLRSLDTSEQARTMQPAHWESNWYVVALIIALICSVLMFVDW